MTDVFISYSRKDIAFARILHQALKENHLETWIDWQDIPPSADWLAEVYEAIEQADSFIFIISETSVASEICGLEIAHAAKNNKRLIPIVINDIDAQVVPNELSVLNWIFFREEDEAYANAIQDLITAIQTDFNWVKEHTRLQNRALEWERKDHEGGFLLRGRDLAEAEAWLAQAAEKDPQPTALQTQYVLASRSASTRRQRITMGAVLAGLVVAIALGILAWTQRNLAVSESNAKATEIVIRQTAEAEAITEAEMRATAQAEAIAEADARATQQSIAEEQRDIAEEQRLQAEARGLAVSAMAVMQENLDLALLLSIEAMQRKTNYFTHNALLSVLQSNTSLVRFIHTGDDSTNAIAFAKDGSYLISAGEDGSIRFLDPLTGNQIAEPLAGHTKQINDIEISPDGTLLVSASDDGSIRLWDLETKQSLGILKTTDLRAIAVTFSQDGSLIFAGYTLGYIWAWDVVNNRELGVLDLNGNEVEGLIIHPDGEYFITYIVVLPDFISQEIKFRDMSTGFEYMESISLEGTYESVMSMALSPDGKRLVFATSTSSEHFLYLWDLEENQEVRKVKHNLGMINSLIYLPNGEYVASGGQSLALWKMDLSTNIVIDEYDTKVTDLSFRSDGQILASSDDDGLIYIYKVYSTIYENLPFQEHHGKGYGVSLAFSPENDFIASTTSNKEMTGDTRIELWNAEDFTFLGYLDLPVENDERTITSLEFSIHGDILIAGTSDGQIYLWDTATRELHGDPIPSPSGVVRFTPDGKRLISVDPTNTIRVWNVEEDDQSNINIDRDYQDFEIHEEPNLLLTILPQGESCPFIISPDGKYIAIEGTGNSIKLLDLETYTEIGDPLEGMPSQVTDFTFNPDGSIVAVGGDDGSILLWDTDTRQRIGEALTGHQDAVIKLIFNKDGTVLYSASDDGTIRLWDMETQLQIGEPISSNAKSLMAEFPGFDPLTASSGFSNARIMDMEASPDGSILVVSNEHQVLWALDLSVETWIKNACFITGRNLTPEEWNLYLGNIPYEMTCPD